MVIQSPAFTLLRPDDFVSYLKRRDRAPGTIKAYGWAVEDFHDYIRSQGAIGLHQVTRNHLEQWQDRLLAAQLRPRSRSLATTGVRQYLKWAGDHEYCDARLAGWLTAVKVQPLQPKPLPAKDLAALIDHYTPRPPAGPSQIPRHQAHQPSRCRMISDHLTHLRDRALFFVLLSTGARVSEALAMPRVGFERCSIRQKGGSQKLLTVPGGVASIVREYLEARVDESPLLFVSHPSGCALHPSGVREIWHRACQRIGIAPFTTHSLRHTYATQLLERGIDSRIVAELLGHKNMQTIMNYTRVLEGSRQRAENAIAEVLQLPSSEPVPGAPPDPRTLAPNTRGRPRFLLPGAS